jgi:hypothetical protein
MLRTVSPFVALAIALALPPVAVASATATATPAHAKHRAKAKRHVIRHWRGYGFLPGYVPPEIAAREREARDFNRGRFYAIPWPRFYRGRWNGGGFGPCYTYTPIGPIWNCGK